MQVQQQVVEATMVPLRNFIHRPYDLTDKILIEEARKVIAESMRVLETHPPPDIFLGRASYEPIPLPYQEE